MNVLASTTNPDNTDPHKPDPHKTDLSDRTQISMFVKSFYGMVAQDDLLAPIFEQTAGVDWATHIEKLTDFWCRSLLHEPGYEGNPYTKHQRVHERSPFSAEHFARWLDLFHEAISRWGGDFAEQAKRQVVLVARVHSQQIMGERYEYPQASQPPRIHLRADPRP